MGLDARGRNGWQEGGWQSMQGAATHLAASCPRDQGHNGCTESRMEGATVCSSSRAEIQGSGGVSSGPGHAFPPQ